MTMKTMKHNQKHKIKQCSSNIIFSRKYHNDQFNSLTEPWWSPRQANIFGILKRYFNSLRNVYLLSYYFLTPDLNLFCKYTTNIIKTSFIVLVSNYFFLNDNSDISQTLKSNDTTRNIRHQRTVEFSKRTYHC